MSRATPDPLAAEFAQATRLHQQGQLDAAERGYRQVLARNAEHAGALGMLGTIALQRGLPLDALPLLEAAVQRVADNPNTWHNLGRARKDSGQGDAALLAYRRACALQPEQPQFQWSLAALLLERNALAEAEPLVRRILARQPEHAHACRALAAILYQQGPDADALAWHDRLTALVGAEPAVLVQRCALLRRLGRDAEARHELEALCRLAPELARAHFDLGNVLFDLHELQAARAAFEHALRLSPLAAEIHHNLGKLLLAMDADHAACVAFQRCLDLDPAFPGAYTGLSTAWRRLERLDEALAAAEKGVQRHPEQSADWGARGLALVALRRVDEALESFRHVLDLDPEDLGACSTHGAALRAADAPAQARALIEAGLARHPDAHILLGNLAVILTDLGDLEGAVAAYDRAIDLQPAHATHYANRASALLQLDRRAAGRADYRYALTLQPDYPEVEMSLGMLDLSEGNFAAGWIGYRARVRRPDLKALLPSFDAPRWQGEVLPAGRTVLVYAEQGFGDTLQFVRLVPQVVTRGIQVLLRVQRPLHSACAAMPLGVVSLHADGDPLPPFDLQCSLLDLPLALGLTVDHIPPPCVPVIDAARAERWQRRLGPRLRPRIGLAWSGNAAHANDRQRSVPLAQLLPLLPQEFEYHVVQKDIRPADAALLGDYPEVVVHAPALDDFLDTAALLQQLDGLLSVDTSVAHLAGTLGVPTALLVTLRPDFRWMYDRSDSPWYPSVRLYRQTTPSRWDEVLAAAIADLPRVSAA
jgi:tetratricopeptide (TPR) repeat protein